MNARTAYDAYRATLLTIAVGIAALTMFGPLGQSVGNGLPSGAVIQQGRTITGQSPVDRFNDDVKIDTSQVATESSTAPSR